MGTFYNPSMVSNGLTIYIDAGNKKCYPGSGTAVKDLTKTRAGFTMASAGFSSNNNGYFTFANNAVISTPHNLLYNFSQMTIGAWFTGSNGTTQSAFCGIFCKDSDTDLGSWALTNGGNGVTVRFGFMNSSGAGVSVDISGYNDLTSPNWVNYQCTYNQQYINIYRNGILISQTAQTAATNLTRTNNVTIGSRDGTVRRYTGNIAICYAYNRALSASEVLQNYNAAKGRFGL